jgi:hypothetical protein
VPYEAPELLRVDPPVERDAAPGFILSRSLEANGRPVAFAFEGAPPQPDGSEMFLDVALLEQSINFRSVAAGHAQPLFYDTLFVDLREALAAAAVAAREQELALWQADRSDDGLSVIDQADLEQDGVVFPKLFRRLTEFLTQQHGQGLAGFLSWVADKREQLLDLTVNNFTHFDNVLAVDGEEIRLTRPRGDRLHQRQDRQRRFRALARRLAGWAPEAIARGAASAHFAA